MSSSYPPARPDAPAGTARPPRRWVPVWIVCAVILVSVLGGFVTAAALPAPATRVVSVDDRVTVAPAPGWALVGQDRVTLPDPSGGTLTGAFAQLSRGSGSLDVLAVQGLDADADGAAVYYAREILRSQLARLTVSGLEHVVLRSGLQAARFGYIGTEPEGGAAIEGSVTVVVGPSGTIAVFDGWAFEGQLELIAEDLARMIDSAEVR